MKTTPADLAILGGPVSFGQPHHVGRPNIPDHSRILANIGEVLENRWLTNGGPFTTKFEEALSERLGTKHCITVANCTLGLILAGRAAGLTGEVIMPSFTFAGTAHAMSWMGVTPVFCDIDPVTYQIDPQAIEALITPRTTGIVGVHLFGRMCDVDALEKIAAGHNLKLLIDGAQAMGCSTPNRSVGTAGDAVVISFHATKVMNTFEGGVIATNDDDLARSTRLMRNFGFVDVDRVDCIGINAKMSEPAAAMGLTSLDALDSFIDVNRTNFDRYRQVLSDIPGIVIRDHDSGFTSNYQYVILEVDCEISGITRDELLFVLEAENVLARRYFNPGCHRLEPYVSRDEYQNLNLPITEGVSDRVLALPTGTAVDDGIIDTIGSIIRVAMTGGARSIRENRDNGNGPGVQVAAEQ